ncbi:hypothetical protein SDRG_00315 [Saprolegnia diclina VS20]|uniref:BZIP domain-containing protein n=1 Tax=Saprolegnia diclina (strain VS20) TaxID=1156394 RepID=T0R6P0_SAPDV|nr:hypothetical protein SDRG_00315 [Saprolegnia diclina VS20]EQC42586.1 hypothetical protein SDRG_00315 [Saprolegnia diclina VS20]|eukprot:XP_008604009.1 hypothetical protein SDRG_00315 [Saprolegnia diclina VS20]
MKETTERRRRNREHVRKHRELNALEKQGLKDYVARLQATVNELTSIQDARRPLHWRDVAMALRAESDRAVSEQQHLRASLQRQEHVAQALWSYCLSMQATPRPLTTTTSWRHASVLGTTPSARRRGFEWLLQHMKCNLGRAFDGVFVPGDAGPGLRLHMTPIGALGAHIVVQKHRVDPFALETVFQYFATQHAEQMRLEDVAPDLRYVRYHYGSASQNIALQYFREHGRILLLSRGIEHDDVVPTGLLKRTWMDWIVLTPIGENATMIQEVYESTSWYGGDGAFVPLETTSPWYQQAVRLLPASAPRDEVFERYRLLFQTYLDEAFPNSEVAGCREWCRNH